MLQHDHSDCGVACLASIIKYYGGECTIEQLRKLSGTSKQGTTLLGLLQAARKLGFEADGLEADLVENLNELSDPAILHVVIESRLQHYLVFYPYIDGGPRSTMTYLLGDPGKGIIEMNAYELDQIWQSKALMKLVPTDKFEKGTYQPIRKKKWIIGLIKEDSIILLSSVFLGVFISLLGISTAIFSQRLIDDILPKGNVDKLVLGLVLVFFLLIVRSGLGYLRGIFMVRQGMNFNNRIIQSFYSNLLSLPKSFFDTRKTGELIARMNDTRRIQSVLSTISGSVVIDFLLIIITLSFVFVYSITIGMVMLSTLPLYFLILYFFNKPIIRSQKEVMSGYATVESNFVDTIQGVADIKLMNKQVFFEKVNGNIYEAFQQRIANLGKLNIKFSFASEIVGTFFILSVFGITSWLVLTKELKLGEMVALLGMAGNAVPSVIRLVIANIQIQEAFVVFDRMFEFTSMEKEVEALGNPVLEDLNLEIQNLSFRFPGRKQILKRISLNLKRGQLVALMGESGGGKSTLLQLIQKFYSQEEGNIIVDKIDLQSVDTTRWRELLGTVSQDVKIFNGNLLFNVTLSDQLEDHERAIAYCEEAGFGKYFSQFPQGYLTLLGEEGINISGGQKQLVAVARALFRKPKYLLLDEATSAMDLNSEKFILSLLKTYKTEMAIMIVTHRPKVAQHCDIIYILEDGRISCKGAPNELMRSRNFFSDSFTEIIGF